MLSMASAKLFVGNELMDSQGAPYSVAPPLELYHLGHLLRRVDPRYDLRVHRTGQLDATPTAQHGI